MQTLPYEHFEPYGEAVAEPETPVGPEMGQEIAEGEGNKDDAIHDQQLPSTTSAPQGSNTELADSNTGMETQVDMEGGNPKILGETGDSPKTETTEIHKEPDCKQPDKAGHHENDQEKTASAKAPDLLSTEACSWEHLAHAWIHQVSSPKKSNVVI